MTHNEKRAHWHKEGLAALISGVIYGVSNVLAGHPLDTIKTKMQVVSEYAGKSAMQSGKHILKTEGLIGFYRGCIPPLCGSSFFRAVQFATFEAFYTKYQHDKYLTTKIPYCMGLEPRIVLGGMLSGTARALLECPFEYSKVKGQTGQKWKLFDVYNGFKATWVKAVGLMTTYFVLVDFFRRNTNTYNSKCKIFVMSGLCSTIGFLVIWPIEIVKNHVQKNSLKKYSIYKIIIERIQQQGFQEAMLRGALPGLSSVFIRNGFAMMTMLKTQSLLTKYGFRE